MSLTPLGALGIAPGALSAAIAAVQGQEVEHVVVLNRDGLFLWQGRGTETEVGHPSIADAIVVHNHPNGSLRFSYRDLQSCFAHNELGVVVVAGAMWSGLFRRFPRWASPPLAYDLMQRWKTEEARPPMDTLARLVGGLLVKGSVERVEP